ncbi:MAG TPA: response regulator transcription factor [Burkholderiales bacterium]|nr:response regulator transcription factor [Burkholderiales bacterium]
MIKVIVADDHELMREGVKKILRGEPGMRVVGEAASVDELLELVKSRDADVLILDINLPVRSGLDALIEIRRAQPAPAVVMLSMYSEDRFALRALKSGAAAYVNKASAAEELILAVRKAAKGGRYIGSVVADLLTHELENPGGAAPHEKLSTRESQILSLIGAGKPAKLIATELSISANTVNTYRARILKKMGMHANAELMRYAIEHELIE